MKFLIIGAGSIGLRHVRNLLSLGHRVSLVDPDPQARGRAAALTNVAVAADLDTARPKEHDAILIATPTHLHLEQARAVLEMGLHLFVEKPLAHTWAGLDQLVALAARSTMHTMVGCNMRFHPGLQRLKQLLESGDLSDIRAVQVVCGHYLPDWHPGQDYRRWYSIRRSEGGGVLLDSIHELDYVRWLLGDPDSLVTFGGKLSGLEGDVEDVVTTLLQYPHRTVAIHLDYVQRPYRRSVTLFGEDGTVEWDETRLRRYNVKTQRWETLLDTADFDFNELYLQEMRHFVRCIETGEEPMNPVAKAAITTKLALLCRQSLEQGRVITGVRERVVQAGPSAGAAVTRTSVARRGASA